VATIRRRKGARGTSYQVRWRKLDGTETSWSCSTDKAARSIQREVELALDTGRDWQPEQPATEGPPTLRVIAEAYQDARALRCRPDTLRVEAYQLDLFLRFVEQRGKGDDVTILSRSLLDEFLGWLRRPETGLHGKQRGMEACVKGVRAAQLLWAWAEGSERWPEIPRPRTVDLPRTAPAPVVAPTWQEMDACITACSGWQKQFAIWLRYTGLRSGESMLVEWRDVDMERGTLSIRPEIDKNGAGRVVPLAPLLLDEIATWGKREGYVIPCNRRPGPREREARGRDLRRAWQRAGVREAVWRRRPDHAFRRGFKSGLLQLGANPDAVDYLQGHNLGAGSRGRYIDPWHALPLREVVAMVPKIGTAGAGENVVQLRRG